MYDLVSFLIRRFLLALCAIFIVATVTFFLMKSIPGDPFAEEMQMSSKESMQALRKHYGLDDPLSVQYVRYIKQIFSLDFGTSLKNQSQKVTTIIKNGFPISAMIGVEALLLAIPLGLLFGTFAALYAKGWPNMACVTLSILGVSIPSFVLASSLQFLFAIYIPIFPVARHGTFMHTVLPAIALAMGPACFIARLLRANMLEILNQQYIQTARLKGLANTRIMFVHVWKNAILPIVAYLGPVSANVLVGSFVVERIFGIPGLGQWFVNGVINRDYPVIGGLTLFYSILLIGINTGIDLLTAFLNPTAQTLSQKSTKTVCRA